MVQSMNDGWLFYKEGDKQKQSVMLPHDAMLHEKRDPKAESGSAGAFFPGGVFCYERKIMLTEDQVQMHLTLEFEGAYKNAEVFVNGQEVYQAAYGYSPFFVILDGHIKAGENTILVKTDNSQQPDSRWYSGAGIYRPVWLHIQPKDHIAIEGIRVKTVSIDPTVMEVSVERTAGKVQVEIIDAEGKQAATALLEKDSVQIPLPKAHLWSEETPYLYGIRASLLGADSSILDQAKDTFGVRLITWSPKGFFVNGKETLLRGGCIHHDNGVLGACTYDESEMRRIRILKENGYNAIRCAHNPCSKALLRACDALGVYIMDETWDMWYSHKSKYDYATEFMSHSKEDLEAMVRRDYNHPSVVMYSIGNEVSEPASQKGVALSQEMADYLRNLDETRAVTAGFNLMIIKSSAEGKGVYKEEGGRNDSNEAKAAGMSSTMFNMITSMVGTGMNKAANGRKADEVTSPGCATLDICGYNYASGRYAKEGQIHPDRIVVGSETFPQDIARNWAMVKKYPYLIGDFMWTAWDYIGEAGVGTWSYEADAKGFDKPYPWLLADTGAFDLLGNPTGEAMWAKAVWGYAKHPLIGVQPCNHPNEKIIKATWRGTNAIPSWSWKNCDGNKVMVEVYADASKVELLVNGKSLGCKKVKDARAIFKTTYVTGNVEAVSYDAAGKEIGRSRLQAAKNASLHLLPEKKEVSVGEIVYVKAVLADDSGNVESNQDSKVQVTVEGGELLGFGSANPRTEDRFDAGEYTTYYGNALAVIRVTDANVVTVQAKTEDGSLVECRIPVI